VTGTATFPQPFEALPRNQTMMNSLHRTIQTAIILNL
jgi:hypothetical protein